MEGAGLPTRVIISRRMNQHRWRGTAVGLIVTSSSTELDRNRSYQDRVLYTARVFSLGLLATRGGDGAGVRRVVQDFRGPSRERRSRARGSNSVKAPEWASPRPSG